MFIISTVVGLYYILYVRTGVDDSYAAYSEFGGTVRDLSSFNSFDPQASRVEISREDGEDYSDMSDMDTVDLHPDENGQRKPETPEVEPPPPPQNPIMQLEVKGIPVGKEILKAGLRFSEVIDNIRTRIQSAIARQTKKEAAPLESKAAELTVDDVEEPETTTEVMEDIVLKPEEVKEDFQDLVQEVAKPQEQSPGEELQQLIKARDDVPGQIILPPPPQLPEVPQAPAGSPLIAPAPPAPLPEQPVAAVPGSEALPAVPVVPETEPQILQQELALQQVHSLSESLDHEIMPHDFPPAEALTILASCRPDIIFRNKHEDPHDPLKGLTAGEATPLIPRVVHQYWDSTDIPIQFAPWIQSWIRQNPGWQYWFWSPADVDRLILKKYPEYQDVYQSLTAENRDNAIRYFIIHSYGGIFADMDIECLKSLDQWVYNHQCFLSEDSREHAYLLNQRFPANAVTSLMGCRANHPFFAAVLHALPEFFHRYYTDPLRATGSLFLDDVFRIYGSNATHTKENSTNVELAEADYFMPTYDSENWDLIDEGCHSNIVDMPFHVSWICTLWMKVREHKNVANDLSLTQSHWTHKSSLPRLYPKLSIIYLLLAETE